MFKHLDVKFHVFDLAFQPYLDDSQKIGSFSILKSCIKLVNDQRVENHRFVIIDRHEKRDKADSRKLFISTAAYSREDQMFKCKMHLIRDKIPSFLDKDNLTFSSVDILKNKELVETTSFYIDMGRKVYPTIICEFNSVGPKISDIEYYFRILSSRKHLHISKACQAKVHMEQSVEKVIEAMQNVFRFKFKAKPENLPSLFQSTKDTFFSDMQLLGKNVDPKSIRVDLSFREQGGKKLVPEKNYKMLSTSKKILNAVLNDTKVIDDIEDFYLEYEDDKGIDRNYSLAKGKVTFNIKCPFKEEKKGQLDTRAMFSEVKEKYLTYKSRKLTADVSQ